MKKREVWILVVILIIIALSLLAAFSFAKKNNDSSHNSPYFCNENSDCVSQCSRGCVNIDWNNINPDTSECFRAWDCSCVNNKCYTDGKPPK